MLVRALVCLFLAVPALAGEDAAEAPADRWPHIRGPASGSGCSAMPPIEALGPPAWTHKTREPILCAPLVWDGVGFVISGTERRGTLEALDLDSGKRLARGTVKGIGLAPRPALYQNTVLLRTDEGRRILAYRLFGSQLRWRWTYTIRKGGVASAPRVRSGEVYITTRNALLRLRIGRRLPVWKRDGALFGEAAVLGPHVYALERNGNKLFLAAFSRESGEPAQKVEVAANGSPASGGTIAAAEGVIAVQLPPENSGRWALVSRKFEDGKLVLRYDRTEKIVADVVAIGSTVVGFHKNEWSFLRTEGRKRSAVGQGRPELKNGATSPVFLAGTGCMGTWAANFQTREILWRLYEQPALTNPKFPPTPADGKLLMVAQDGKHLMAVTEEKIGP